VQRRPDWGGDQVRRQLFLFRRDGAFKPGSSLLSVSTLGGNCGTSRAEVTGKIDFFTARGVHVGGASYEKDRLVSVRRAKLVEYVSTRPMGPFADPGANELNLACVASCISGIWSSLPFYIKRFCYLACRLCFSGGTPSCITCAGCVGPPVAGCIYTCW
jgi:hypothetical protein